MRWLAGLFLIGLLLSPHAATAQVDLMSRDTVQGVLTLGAAAADGAASWTQGGFGKTRYGRGAYGLAGLEAVWRPQLGDSFTVVVDGVAQPRIDRPVGLAEAYLLYKPVPTSAWRVEARAGLLYPPISLEHDRAPGEPWAVQDTLTPSAINSWLGEEIKATGVEGRATHVGAAGNVSATLGLFGRNDTAGTLMAFRGWSLSDLVGAAGASFALPPLSDYAAGIQAPRTQPTAALDGRIGAYAQIAWTAPSGGLVQLSGYDNNAQIGAGQGGQWAWRTQFYDLGLAWPLGSHTSLTGQAMQGRTRAQLGWPPGYGVDVRFDAAYLKLTRRQGAETFSARFDLFDARSPHPTPGALHYHPGPLDPDETYAETGWAALAAWKHRITSSQSVVAELIRAQWTRDYQSAFAASPRQVQNSVQVAFRQAF